MKLNFRNLKKEAFTIEAEPSILVGDVKKQVAERQGAEVAQIRLIHSGKVLVDDKPIETYGIKETDHIICMVQKPKTTVASSSATPSTPAPAAPASTPAAPAPATSSSTATQNPPGTPTPAGAASASQRAFDDTSPLMLGPQRQAAVANMESMGFERPQIERAMRAAFFNPDRAVEFLLNGIPENLQNEAAGRGGAGGANQPAGGAAAAPATGGTPSSPPAATTTAAAGTDTEAEPVNLFEAAAAASRNTGGGGAGATGSRTGGAAGGLPSGAAGGAGGNLDFLRDNPMFQQLRMLVQQQPSMLENVLQQVSAANPQLAQLISQNPEQFLQLLTEGETGEGGEGGMPLPPGAGDIRVTEEERDAIERLCGLGFERDLVIQAYFACDKNEELAANFLFDQPQDEGEGQ